MSTQPDHELEDLEDDQSVPPRPEETIADAPGHEGAADVDASTEPPGDAS
jgi:hypothetical protein